MNRIIERIDKIRVSRDWSIYKLAQIAGVSQQTIHKWLDGKSSPTLASLELISQAFEMTLAELTAKEEDEIFVASPETKEMLDAWSTLTKPQKEAVKQMILSYKI